MKLLSKTVLASPAVEEIERNDEDRYSLVLKASSEPATLAKAGISLSFVFEKDDLIFMNGYQSWTYSPERRPGEYDNSLRFCPKGLDQRYGFSRYSDVFTEGRPRKGTHRGYTYAYIRRGERYILFGSLCEETGFTKITMDPAKNEITFEKGCTGRLMHPGEEYRALDIYASEGTDRDVFDGWFAAMGIVPMQARPLMGYTSWYNHYQKISRDKILRDLSGMRALERKPDVFQIDDGYEKYVGDWLHVDENKFPEGLEPIISKISDEGLCPGIWISPFVCEKESDLYRSHPDWLLIHEGEPVYAGGNWSGAYALDIYNDGLREYLKECVDHYREMGIKLFKMDFLYAACMYPREDRTRGEVMEDAMDFLRNICGDAWILACGVPLASAFGKVEYCRIGPDVTLSYDDVPYMRAFHAERPSTMHTQRNTVYRRQLDGRAFLNDPDVFVLRDTNTSLSESQKLTLARINALFGSILFASDDFSEYSEKRREQFSQTDELNLAEDMKVRVLKHTKGKHVISVRYRLNGNEKEDLFEI